MFGHFIDVSYFVFHSLFLDITSIIGVGYIQELDLGIVVKYALNGISHYLDQVDYVSTLKKKLEAVPAMTTDEVKQVSEKKIVLDEIKYRTWFELRNGHFFCQVIITF